MNKTAALFIVMLLAYAPVQACTDTAVDIRAFIREADLCEHFAGEWDSSLSKKRKNELERGVRKHCARAQRQLEILSVKYKNDATSSALIADHANEPVKEFRK